LRIPSFLQPPTHSYQNKTDTAGIVMSVCCLLPFPCTRGAWLCQELESLGKFFEIGDKVGANFRMDGGHFYVGLHIA
jgi:hypothetical protein